MHKAAQGGQLEMIKFLSQTFPTMVRERDSNDGTMLHWATWRGHCEVARYLIEELKIDPQDRTKVRKVELKEVCPKYRLSVLIVACNNNNGVTWTCM